MKFPTVLLLLAALHHNPAQAASPVGVVFMGDSITAHWNEAPQFTPAPLTTMIPGSVNAGISGQTAVQMLARFKTDVLAKRPTVVVIEAGTNDLLHTYDPAVYGARDADDPVSAIAEMAGQAAHAGIRVIITTIPDTSMPAYGVTAADVNAVNARIRLLCNAYGYRYLDYQHTLQSSPGVQDPTLFIADQIHPNEAGYAHMLPALKLLLSYDGVR